MKIINISKIFKAIIFRFPFFKKHVCVCCHHHLAHFIPYRNGIKGVAPLMKSLDVIGSDVDNFECPWCGSTDRERHLFLYLQETNLLERFENATILHFAPEARLQKLIESKQPKKYVKCDLFPTRSDMVTENIMSMSFPDHSFDFLIANHVLEHVEDVGRALMEISRVLKPGSYAILQTPYSELLNKTWSDEGVKTEQARLHAFGQEDHVRLFGKDIFSIFSQYGLKNRVSFHHEHLKDYPSNYYGVNMKEPFFLFKRES